MVVVEAVVEQMVDEALVERALDEMEWQYHDFDFEQSRNHLLNLEPVDER